MTTLLSQAFQEAEQLSEEAQNQIAKWLLAEVRRVLSEVKGNDKREIDDLNSTKRIYSN